MNGLYEDEQRNREEQHQLATKAERRANELALEVEEIRAQLEQVWTVGERGRGAGRERRWRVERRGMCNGEVCVASIYCISSNRGPGLYFLCDIFDPASIKFY